MLKHIIIGTFVVSALTISQAREVKAITYDEALEACYEALVTEGKNTVSFSSEDNISWEDLYNDLVAIDKDDTLYDGRSLDIRGTAYVSKKGSHYTLTLLRAYDIAEADALTDKMVKEIKETLPENLSDKKLYREIARYIRKNYSYDIAAIMDDNEIANFVEAYNTDRKIVCAGYASLLYLIGRKMGLDCEVYIGEGHAYNGIKFEGDDKYTAIDISTCGCLAGHVPLLGGIFPEYGGPGKYKARIDRLNAPNPKRYASIIDTLEALML